MPRSAEPVRRRLQEAAVDLYARRGFDEVTAAEIAAAAGVTERTFFRHFVDKREALFDGEAEVVDAINDGVAKAPDDSTTLELAQAGMAATVPLVERTRSFAEPRHRVVARTPALAERGLAKEAALTTALTRAVEERGIDPAEAALAARIASTSFVEARNRWLEQPEKSLSSHLHAVETDVRRLLSATPAQTAVTR